MLLLLPSPRIAVVRAAEHVAPSALTEITTLPHLLSALILLLLQCRRVLLLLPSFGVALVAATEAATEAVASVRWHSLLLASPLLATLLGIHLILERCRMLLLLPSPRIAVVRAAKYIAPSALTALATLRVLLSALVLLLL